ncbi:MAG: hypothetical protein M0Q93_00895 [Terrimicrobiaceae bacterium]|jgi:hypothetical protein|nr:hypothetical protein [Terrimicrobiaceae bacterium]
MKCLAIALICLTTCACSTERHRAATSPDLSAATKRSQDITETITLAESDSKEVKKAILSMQESGKVLRGLNGRAILLLDQNDYKIRKLLGK